MKAQTDMTTITAPNKNEYNEFYDTYVSKARIHDLPRFLKIQLSAVTSMMEELPADKIDYAYAQGKWTVKQVLRHLIDTERVMGYRLMCVARAEQTNLPGFEQDDYMSCADDSAISWENLIGEFITLRHSNLAMIHNLNDTALNRQGKMSGYPVTARALVYILAGHVEHHIGILKDRYLN